MPEGRVRVPVLACERSLVREDAHDALQLQVGYADAVGASSSSPSRVSRSDCERGDGRPSRAQHCLAAGEG